MKKNLHSWVVALSFLVFITSSGMTANSHYYADKFQNVSLNFKSDGYLQQSQTKNKCKEISDDNPSTKTIDSCCKENQIAAKHSLNDTKKDEPSVLAKTIFIITDYFNSILGQKSANENEKEETTELSIFPLLKQGLGILLQQFRL